MASNKLTWVGKPFKPDQRQAERGSNGPTAQKTFDSKKAAIKAAKQDARIPSDSRPFPREPEKYKGFGEQHKVSGHDYNMGRGKTYSVVDHHLGHDFKQPGGSTKNPGSHVHVRPSHDSHGHIPTAYEHYYYKEN